MVRNQYPEVRFPLEVQGWRTDSAWCGLLPVIRDSSEFDSVVTSAKVVVQNAVTGCIGKQTTVECGEQQKRGAVGFVIVYSALESNENEQTRWAAAGVVNAREPGLS